MKRPWFVCLNAQYGNVKEGESKIIGPYVYQKVLCDDSSRIPNRALLLEYCGAYDMMAINTCFQYPEYYLVTYRNLVTCPFDNVFDGGFSQIDHILCHQNNAGVAEIFLSIVTFSRLLSHYN